MRLSADTRGRLAKRSTGMAENHGPSRAWRPWRRADGARFGSGHDWTTVFSTEEGDAERLRRAGAGRTFTPVGEADCARAREWKLPVMAPTGIRRRGGSAAHGVSNSDVGRATVFPITPAGLDGPRRANPHEGNMPRQATRQVLNRGRKSSSIAWAVRIEITWARTLKRGLRQVCSNQFPNMRRGAGHRGSLTRTRKKD